MRKICFTYDYTSLYDVLILAWFKQFIFVTLNNLTLIFLIKLEKYEFTIIKIKCTANNIIKQEPEIHMYFIIEKLFI